MTEAVPQNIAVLRHRFIGDTLLTIPFLRALRHKYPQAVIDLYVSPLLQPLMSQCPYINTAYGFEPRDYGFYDSLRMLRGPGYDSIYLLKRSFSTALMAFMAGIPNRIGFSTEMRQFLLTQGVPYQPTRQHESQCYLDLLDTRPSHMSLDVNEWLDTPVPETILAQLEGDNTPKIVLHPTSTNVAKCWPIEHFQTLATRLYETYKAQFLFMGSLEDYPTIRSLIEDLPPDCQNHCLNLCGHTSVEQSLALLRHVDLVVANDSGMIHMAAAMDRPVIALFGPMDPTQWAPLSSKASVITHPSLSCRPCRMHITCDHRYPCMTEIEPELVFQLCQQQLH